MCNPANITLSLSLPNGGGETFVNLYTSAIQRKKALTLNQFLTTNIRNNEHIVCGHVFSGILFVYCNKNENPNWYMFNESFLYNRGKEGAVDGKGFY